MVTEATNPVRFQLATSDTSLRRCLDYLGHQLGMCIIEKVSYGRTCLSRPVTYLPEYRHIATLVEEIPFLPLPSARDLPVHGRSLMGTMETD